MNLLVNLCEFLTLHQQKYLVLKRVKKSSYPLQITMPGSGFMPSTSLLATGGLNAQSELADQ